ncbi:MAG TPA: ABC transporter ATP-binding protein [Actinomycetota bacterium]|nr:ABC transporter ATP-binding protein [Actinomycetota bacterium]
MAIIEIEGLRKEYRKVRGGSTVALDRLDVSVQEGGVYGFLGPNGAGKTTTIRCLLGLVRPTNGRARLLGAESSTELARVIGRIGSIVETPAMYPRFTGRRNLQLLGRLNGIGGKTVDRILERVGLQDRADDHVRTYSLGMKQRLGIGAALLKDPELLILDEPANGLDPAGIKEVRDLLRTLGAEGRTVFVSSHQLSEVQMMCDRVAILSHGRCVAAGPVGEVLARGRHEALIVRVGDLRAGLEALSAAGIDATLDSDHLRVTLPVAEAARVTEALARRDLYLSELRPEEVSLETVFLELTQDLREMQP